MSSLGESGLVGREAELHFVREVLASPSRGGVVIAGAPGVGKTRLAREALATAETAGARTEWVPATRATSGVPMAALVSLLPTGVPDEDDELHLFRAMAAALDAGGAEQLVIGVDDAHLLDPMGAAFVLHLALSGAATVVATVRAGEPAPGPVTTLWKDGAASVLEIQSLSADESVTAAETALGGVLERATATWLAEASRGNPLFLRELLLSGLETGALAASGGAWRWVPGASPGLRLIEIVEQRLEGLSASRRRTLEILAAAEPVGLDVLIRATSEEEVAGLERAGFIEVTGAGQRIQCRLAHPVYGEALRASTPVAAGWAIRRRLADEVEASGARRWGDALAVATWRLESGGEAPPDVLTRGAEEANEAFAHELAEDLAAAALDAGGGVRAAVALGEAAARRGRLARADEVLSPWEEEMLSPWEGASRGEAEAARYLVERTHVLYRSRARAAEAHAFLDRAEGLFGTASWGALVRTLRAEILVASGSLEEALELALPLVAEPLGERIRLRAVSSAGLALALLGKTQQALSLIDGDLHAASPPEAAPLPLQVSRVAALFLEGRLDDVEALMLPAYDLADAHGDDPRRGLAAMVLGRAALVRGEVWAARRWLTEAATLFEEADPDGHLALALSMLAQAEALAGDLRAARRARRAATRAPRPLSVWERDRHLADVWLAAASGEHSRAREIAAEAADAADRPTDEALLLHEALRVGHPTREASSRLGELAAGAESSWIPVLAEHASALDEDDGKALEAVTARFEAFGATLLAAEAAAAASAAYRREGHRSSARRMAARRRALGEACEAPPTPALAAAEPGPELTRREREVVALAARGATNAEIAERLVVSVRTVESHLYRSFAKLGVEGREELGAVHLDGSQ